MTGTRSTSETGASQKVRATYATQAVIVWAPGAGDARRVIGGLTLFERLLRQLSELGTMQEILVVASRDLSLPEPSRRVPVPVRFLSVEPAADPWDLLRQARPRLRDRVLVVGGDLLVDPRLLSWLASQTTDVLLKARSGMPPALLGSIRSAGLLESSSGPVRAVVIAVSDFPTYWEAQRGDVPVHLLQVLSADDAAEGWRTLLDHVQKRTLDLPARLFDPPFENLLLRILCPTRITPNQVTLATGVFGFTVTVLLANGWLLTGLLLAVFVEVLDGVDGKLARMKRMTSRAGELEHVLDFFYENSWYLALALFLHGRGIDWAWEAGIAMVAFDLADHLVNLWFSRSRGRLLIDTSSFLRSFRLVSGRRNVYVWMLLAGALFGNTAVAFACTATWAGITVVVDVVFVAFESWRISRGLFEAPPSANSGLARRK